MTSETHAPEERRYLPILIGGALVCVVLFGAVNFVVDPLQIFRRASPPAVYIENQRHQNAGLIRTHDYTTIIVGTSHTENFSPRLIESLSGEKTIKLSIEGSKAAEQAAVVQAAIDAGGVERVIWGLDHLAFRDSPVSPWGETALPRHLYEPSLATVGRYLLSLDTLLLSRDAWLGHGHHDLETLNRWAETSRFGPERVAESWRRIRRNVAREKARDGNDFSPTVTLTRKKVDFFVGALVRRNPDVRFDLFFSPYSVVAYLADQLISGHEFEERLAFKAGVVDLVGQAQNVRIFDYQTQRALTHDLARYKDVHHFDAAASDWIVRSIESDEGRVAPGAYLASLEEQRRQLAAFRVAACRPGGARIYCLSAPPPVRSR